MKLAIEFIDGKVVFTQGVGDLMAGVKQNDLSRISAYQGADLGLHTGLNSDTVGRHGEPFGQSLNPLLKEALDLGTKLLSPKILADEICDLKLREYGIKSCFDFSGTQALSPDPYGFLVREETRMNQGASSVFIPPYGESGAYPHPVGSQSSSRFMSMVGPDLQPEAPISYGNFMSMIGK